MNKILNKPFDQNCNQSGDLPNRKSKSVKNLEKIDMRIVKIVMLLLALVVWSDVSSAQTRRPKTTKTPAVSDVDISSGLKDALFQGVKNAVDSLGEENGFLDNVRVKIPLPRTLQKIEKTLRFAGQSAKVDEFVEAMNRAAERAVPEATDIFVDSIKQMTFSDARNILFSKQDDAATQFFRRTSETKLREKFRPIVEDFTGKVGVTQKYKQMIGSYGFLGKVVGQDATDLDGYVTQKALDGLFLLVADEEKNIRRDPIGRTTSILKKVFGILK